MGFCTIVMGINMKENGEIILNRDMVSILMQMVMFIQDSILMIINMEKENLNILVKFYKPMKKETVYGKTVFKPNGNE